MTAQTLPTVTAGELQIGDVVMIVDMSGLTAQRHEVASIESVYGQRLRVVFASGIACTYASRKVLHRAH